MRASRFSPVVCSLLVAAACGSPPPAQPPVAKVIAPPPPPAPPPPASEADLPLPIDDADATWGSRNAYVTVVMFGDLQCPFTARSFATMRLVEETYGPEKLRVVWKNEPLPFHAESRAAAEAAQGVLAIGGRDAFWSFVGAAFHEQKELGGEAFARFATAAGVDAARIRAGLDAHTWAAKVDADRALAKKVGVLGTPQFFVNGVMMSGAQPLDKFVTLIDAELVRAKERESKGTPRDRLYAELSAESLAKRAQQAEPAKEEEEKPDTTTVWKVPVGKSPVRGKATALVTIIEVADFQCPFCKRVLTSLDQVRATYGDKVRFVWKDEPLPFHPRALPAAELAREARAQKGDAAFWTMHDALFDSQPKLEDADLERVAVASGLDAKRAMAAVRAKKYDAAIQADADLAEDFHAEGTPHFFINGRRLVGAQPFEKFREIIDEEIARAEALVAKGTAPTALYDALIADGKGPAEPEKKHVAIPAGAPSKGSATAPVVIQEWADFQCPFSRRVEQSLDDVIRAYPGKVRLVYRDLPLPNHANAPLAAEAARAALAQRGPAAYWAMHDRLFQQQSVPDGLSRASLDGYAAMAGLDMAKWGAALDGHTYTTAVEADARAAKDAGITGTPTFLIGDYVLAGAQPVARFRRLIDRVLRETKGAPAASSGATAPWMPRAPADLPSAGSSVVGAGLVVKTTQAAGATAKPAAAAGMTLTVHYVGRLADGTEFDSSLKRGTPFVFTLGQGTVIKGWDQGLVGMKVGEKRTLTIPPSLAYGERGVPPRIPPSATLVFDVELVDVK